MSLFKANTGPLDKSEFYSIRCGKTETERDWLGLHLTLFRKIKEQGNKHRAQS